jgi:formylglycine-generating enzyme required for sulfatase activity
MITLDGGRFTMGSEQFYADEGPVHEEFVAPFQLDRSPVTNRAFRRFVDDTAYLTTAERELPRDDFPELSAAERAAGSLAFRSTTAAVDLANWRQWWSWEAGASWRHPFGVSSTIDDKDDHPVVQVSFEDATAYAAWANKRLPTEQEWEFAARVGHEQRTYAWGEEAKPDGRLMANTWQGAFPYLNSGAMGWVGTSPVGSFPANDFGFVDLIGNVWEWTTTPYAPRHPIIGGSCCAPGDERTTTDAATRVLKGGSHLCAPEYCLRYRPAARSPQSVDTSTTHIGFRCARST